MWVSKYFVYFVVYGFMGWIYESAYCTIKGGKWENRGFLYGPIVPIYGAGAVALTAIADALNFYGVSYKWWQVFIVAYLGSVVLEFSTSWILEKLFHAYWWDYSNMPLNIQGRVCLPFSICFGLAGLLVTYGIAPFTRNIISVFSPIGLEFMGLIFMLGLGMDIALTVSAITNFARNVVAMQETLNDHMEEFVVTVQEKTQTASEAMEEEKERFSRESMKQAVTSMGAFARRGVQRVRGFKLPQIERKIAFDTAFDAIKRHVPRRKKNKEIEQ